MTDRSILRRNILVLVLFAIGLSVFAYPAVTGFINEQSQSQVVYDYEKAIDALSDDDKARSREKALAYNESLAQTQGEIQDPFGGASAQASEPAESGVEVVSFLSIGDVIGSVQIPKIGVKLPIYEGTAEAVLQKGVGWMKGTSLPVGGESSHCVLSAHRGLPTSKLFTELDQLDIGDEFFIRNSGDILAYRVYEVRIIEPRETEALALVEGEDIVTLMTCHPYMVNNLRLLVTGERIPYTGQLESSDEVDAIESLSPAAKDLFMTVVVISLLVALVALFLWRPWASRENGGDGNG